jgi:MoxR-like ATPase
MLKVLVGYPSPAEEFSIVDRVTGPMEPVSAILSTADLMRMQARADAVYVDPALVEYSVRLASATRNPAAFGLPDLQRYITYGASPRASINMILAGRALALLRGRDYALPQDLLDVSRDVMRHRMVLSFEALSDDVSPDRLLTTILEAVRLPVVPLREPSDVRRGA